MWTAFAETQVAHSSVLVRERCTFASDHVADSESNAAECRRDADRFAVIILGEVSAARTVRSRELLDHLLAALAPDDVLVAWCPQPTDKECVNGKWARRVQLSYIFRNARAGGTERLVDNIVEFVLSLFYPQNSAVHMLVAPHPPEGMQLILIEFQGQVAAILHAAGY